MILDDTDGDASTLYIDVTETVKASILAKALGLALGALPNALAGLVPGGSVITGVLTAVTGGIGTAISNALGKDNVSLIGSVSIGFYAEKLLAAAHKMSRLN